MSVLLNTLCSENDYQHKEITEDGEHTFWEDGEALM